MSGNRLLLLGRCLVASAIVVAACAAPSSSEPVRPATTRTAATSSVPFSTTAHPTTTTRAPAPLPLQELELWAFPGPEHYEGDLLTFQLPLGGFDSEELVSASLAVDGVDLGIEGELRRDPLLGNLVTFPDAYPAEVVGGHWAVASAELASERAVVVTERFVVRPAAGRPPQEEGARWEQATLDCCTVSYLRRSAAARDIDELLAAIDIAAAAVEAHFGLELSGVELVLIDTLWGNGGYAGGEVVVSYLDRDFSPGRAATFEFTLLHELVHAITDQIESGTPWPLVEGVAVQFTGGHFKSEPLGQRARALADRGELPGLRELFDDFNRMQHESRYVAAGAFTEYVVATYGRDALLDLYSAEVEASGADWLDSAAATTLDADLATLQAGFSDWVGGHEAGRQGLDLDLTIRLQEARRAYQATYAPYQNYFVFPSVTETGQPSLAMREARSARLVAVEALIAHGQDLINAGVLDAAAPVVAEVERIIAEGTVGVGLSAEFLAVAKALEDDGYELVAYVPGSGRATAIAEAPNLVTVEIGGL